MIEDDLTPGSTNTSFTFKVLPRPSGATYIKNESIFIGKKPNEYNPGSILEIEYEFSGNKYKELFIRSKYMTTEYLTNIKTGIIINCFSDQFDKNYSNIINIIVKKET